MSESMTALAECENCKKKFSIDKSVVQFKKECTVEGESIFLTYYDCPSCGKRHYVQIDDCASLKKLEEVKRQFITLSVAKRKGKAISQKQSDKFKKSRERLANYRTTLMKEYTGKLVYDSETDTSFELRFSV